MTVGFWSSFIQLLCAINVERKVCSMDIDYKSEIIVLLEKVSSKNILKRVYKLLEYLYIKEGV